MKIALIHDFLDIYYSEQENRTIESHHNRVIGSITSALEELGHEVELVEANSQLREHLIKIEPQFAFNYSLRKDKKSQLALAPLQLEQLKIPYSGCSPQVCISAFNKYKTKLILQNAGVATSKYCLITDCHEIRIPHFLTFPIFIKPITGGCSLGINERNLVYSQESCEKVVKEVIEKNHQPVLIEQYLPGREFTVGILGNNPPRLLPIREFIFDSNLTNHVPFRCFQTKMKHGGNEKAICPAWLSKKEEESIRNLALNAFQAVGCRDYARIDIRCDMEGSPYVIEINALPSLIPQKSSFAIMARIAGIPFKDLIREILLYASMRYDISFEHIPSRPIQMPDYQIARYALNRSFETYSTEDYQAKQ
ncbi:MAG TPA: ATP-grasp domain-containing protein [Anaerolineae bacterium]|nr:ATP-grasp domain-containing protein [Anaerolineae bacterium]